MPTWVSNRPSIRASFRGPRMLVATRALVATGAYGPKGFEAGAVIPQGAEEADGANLVTAVRHQIGAGADVVKLYADYHWRAGEPSRPTFSEVGTARSGRGSTQRRPYCCRTRQHRGGHA